MLSSSSFGPANVESDFTEYLARFRCAIPDQTTFIDPRNLKFQTNYLAGTKRIKSDLQRNEWSEIARPALRRYEVLFVPGFHYLTDRSAGADFANQRQFFHELGVRVQLIKTEEDGTVEANAAIMAANIRALRDA